MKFLFSLQVLFCAKKVKVCEFYTTFNQRMIEDIVINRLRYDIVNIAIRRFTESSEYLENIFPIYICEEINIKTIKLMFYYVIKHQLDICKYKFRKDFVISKDALDKIAFIVDYCGEIVNLDVNEITLYKILSDFFRKKENFEKFADYCADLLYEIYFSGVNPILSSELFFFEMILKLCDKKENLCKKNIFFVKKNPGEGFLASYVNITNHFIIEKQENKERFLITSFYLHLFYDIFNTLNDQKIEKMTENCNEFRFQKDVSKYIQKIMDQIDELNKKFPTKIILREGFKLDIIGLEVFSNIIQLQSLRDRYLDSIIPKFLHKIKKVQIANNLNTNISYFKLESSTSYQKNDLFSVFFKRLTNLKNFGSINIAYQIQSAHKNYTQIVYEKENENNIDSEKSSLKPFLMRPDNKEIKNFFPFCHPKICGHVPFSFYSFLDLDKQIEIFSISVFRKAVSLSASLCNIEFFIKAALALNLKSSICDEATLRSLMNQNIANELFFRVTKLKKVSIIEIKIAQERIIQMFPSNIRRFQTLVSILWKKVDIDLIHLFKNEKQCFFMDEIGRKAVQLFVEALFSEYKNINQFINKYNKLDSNIVRVSGNIYTIDDSHKTMTNSINTNDKTYPRGVIQDSKKMSDSSQNLKTQSTIKNCESPRVIEKIKSSDASQTKPRIISKNPNSQSNFHMIDSPFDSGRDNENKIDSDVASGDFSDSLNTLYKNYNSVFKDIRGKDSCIDDYTYFQLKNKSNLKGNAHLRDTLIIKSSKNLKKNRNKDFDKKHIETIQNDQNKSFLQPVPMYKNWFSIKKSKSLDGLDQINSDEISTKGLRSMIKRSSSDALTEISKEKYLNHTKFQTLDFFGIFQNEKPKEKISNSNFLNSSRVLDTTKTISTQIKSSSGDSNIEKSDNSIKNLEIQSKIISFNHIEKNSNGFVLSSINEPLENHNSITKKKINVKRFEYYNQELNTVNKDSKNCKFLSYKELPFSVKNDFFTEQKYLKSSYKFTDSDKPYPCDYLLNMPSNKEFLSSKRSKSIETLPFSQNPTYKLLSGKNKSSLLNQRYINCTGFARSKSFPDIRLEHNRKDYIIIGDDLSHKISKKTKNTQGKILYEAKNAKIQKPFNSENICVVETTTNLENIQIQAQNVSVGCVINNNKSDFINERSSKGWDESMIQKSDNSLKIQNSHQNLNSKLKTARNTQKEKTKRHFNEESIINERFDCHNNASKLKKKQVSEPVDHKKFQSKSVSSYAVEQNIKAQYSTMSNNTDHKYKKNYKENTNKEFDNSEYQFSSFNKNSKTVCHNKHFSKFQRSISKKKIIEEPIKNFFFPTENRINEYISENLEMNFVNRSQQAKRKIRNKKHNSDPYFHKKIQDSYTKIRKPQSHFDCQSYGINDQRKTYNLYHSRPRYHNLKNNNIEKTQKSSESKTCTFNPERIFQKTKNEQVKENFLSLPKHNEDGVICVDNNKSQPNTYSSHGHFTFQTDTAFSCFGPYHKNIHEEMAEKIILDSKYSQGEPSSQILSNKKFSSENSNISSVAPHPSFYEKENLCSQNIRQLDISKNHKICDLGPVQKHEQVEEKTFISHKNKFEEIYSSEKDVNLMGSCFPNSTKNLNQNSENVSKKDIFSNKKLSEEHQWVEFKSKLEEMINDAEKFIRLSSEILPIQINRLNEIKDSLKIQINQKNFKYINEYDELVKFSSLYKNYIDLCNESWIVSNSSNSITKTDIKYLKNHEKTESNVPGCLEKSNDELLEYIDFFKNCLENIGGEINKITENINTPCVDQENSDINQNYSEVIKKDILMVSKSTQTDSLSLIEKQNKYAREYETSSCSYQNSLQPNLEPYSIRNQFSDPGHISNNGLMGIPAPNNLYYQQILLPVYYNINTRVYYPYIYFPFPN